MEWIEWIKVLVIIWALKDMASFLGEIIYDIKIKNKILNVLKLILSYILTCSDKCFPFWFSLILTGDLFVSALISIMINYLAQIEYKYKKTKL
jgi:hypothetical protein